MTGTEALAVVGPAAIGPLGPDAGPAGHTLAFLIGLAGLLLAGRLVVRASTAIGRILGLSPLVIGLTIVAAGTSAPEFAVVAQAVAVDDPSLAVGGIIGSNIANVLLVLGCAAAMGTIHVTSRAVRIDIPVVIAASMLFLVLALDNRLDRLDGGLMAGMLVVFVGWSIRSARRESGIGGSGADKTVRSESTAADPQSTGSGTSHRPSPAKLALELSAGIALLALAARFTVSGAEGIAIALGVPELIIGLTIVAIGTSAPEIVTTLVAAYRGERDLAVGNALGSNLFNILGVLGVSSMIVSEGIPVAPDAVELDLPIMVAVAIACLPMFVQDHRLNRWEGWVFLGYYAAYLVFLVLDATGHRASDPFALVMVAFVVPLTVVTVATIMYRRWRTTRQDRSRRRFRSTGDRDHEATESRAEGNVLPVPVNRAPAVVEGAADTGTSPRMPSPAAVKDRAGNDHRRAGGRW